MRIDIITAIVQGDHLQTNCHLPVPWWSFTKTALAAAALALVARSRLRLDEAPPGQPFTLRQLLQHRAGLPDYGSLPDYHRAVDAGDTPWPVADMLARAGAETLIGSPGQDFAYSNIGYLLVRQLIEQAHGTKLAVAMAELVLAPLGLTNVNLAEAPQDLDQTAWGNEPRYNPAWVYHGLLVGPASMAVLLLHRLLAGHLLPAPLLREMCTPQPVLTSEPQRPWCSVGYGLGLALCEADGGLFAGHTGGGPGSVSAIYQRIEGPAASRRTAAAFAQLDTPGKVEREAVRLTVGQGSRAF